jgi:acetyl-CoA carboxylase biotin carboxyl carrier protein
MAARKEQSEPAAKASVNLDELRELIALLRENGLAELELEREDFRVRLRREGTSVSGDHGQSIAAPAAVPAPAAGAPVNSAPSAGTPSHPGAQASTAASQDQDLHMISSPIVGTFYRSASPTAEPFVKIGASVEPGTVVCIIEAMKLMNEIQAEATGEVVKIYVENGQPVEYGQPLFGIKS